MIRSHIDRLGGSTQTYKVSTTPIPYQSVPQYDDSLSQNIHTWLDDTATATEGYIDMTNQPYTPIIQAPTPQRSIQKVLQSPAIHHNGGLGIRYPDPQSPPAGYEPYSALSPPQSALSPPTNSNGLSYYPLPPHQHDSYAAAQANSGHFSETSPFTTPRRTRNGVTHSRSPSISPTNMTRQRPRLGSPTRSTRQQSPTRSMTSVPIPNLSHQRRKSMGKPATAIGKGSKTPKTPRTPTGGAFGFVNFTPADSAKLLSDVAPSGSSKTRLRREQEAREKRRRLSEAAVKVVRRLGGRDEDLRGVIAAR